MPDKLIEKYKFVQCNSVSGKKQGGVGIFYKESLPLQIHSDLSFNECLVVELKFASKKIFFIVLYSNPYDKADSSEFLKFSSDLENLCNRISEEMLIAGDFNGHCQQW